MTSPVVSSRQSTTPRYSGVASMTQRTPDGKVSIGKKVAEKRNIGMVVRVMNSKSCQDRIHVVDAIPMPAIASPMSNAAGRASSVHHDDVSPIATMTRTNAAE